MQRVGPIGTSQAETNKFDGASVNKSVRRYGHAGELEQQLRVREVELLSARKELAELTQELFMARSQLQDSASHVGGVSLETRVLLRALRQLLAATRGSTSIIYPVIFSPEEHSRHRLTLLMPVITHISNLTAMLPSWDDEFGESAESAEFDFDGLRSVKKLAGMEFLKRKVHEAVKVNKKSEDDATQRMAAMRSAIVISDFEPDNNLGKSRRGSLLMRSLVDAEKVELCSFSANVSEVGTNLN